MFLMETNLGQLDHEASMLTTVLCSPHLSVWTRHELLRRSNINTTCCWYQDAWMTLHRSVDLRKYAGHCWFLYRWWIKLSNDWLTWLTFKAQTSSYVARITNVSNIHPTFQHDYVLCVRMKNCLFPFQSNIQVQLVTSTNIVEKNTLLHPNRKLNFFCRTKAELGSMQSCFSNEMKENGEEEERFEMKVKVNQWPALNIIKLFFVGISTVGNSEFRRSLKAILMI